MTEHPVEEFISGLYHQEKDVRRAAAPTMILLLRSPGTDSSDRDGAACALGHLGDPVAVTPLVSALGDDASRVHWDF